MDGTTTVARPAATPPGQPPVAGNPFFARLGAPLALRAFEYWIVHYRRTWRGTAVSMLVSPVLFLGAMGVGLGSLVNSARSGGVQGLPYLVYLAPGLLAAGAMQ